MALFALTGCTKGEADILTLHDTESLYIERQGAETRVYDRIGEAQYTFTSHRARVKKGDPAQIIKEADTTADTDTITIQTVHGLIIVTDKTAGTTYFIRQGAR
jgi:hypothetical protein